VARGASVGLVLLVGFAVDALVGLTLRGASRLPLRCCIEHDARRCVLIAMGGVFDQLLLGHLEAL
jgi:hypothetical protein